MTINSSSHRILIIEDNLTSAKTLALFLKQAGLPSIHACDGASGLQSFDKDPCSLVLLDLMLPDHDGLFICQSLRQKTSIPIIMLTARSTEDDIVAGLDAGANDYVCKPYRSKELLARIRRALGFESHGRSTSTHLRCGLIEIDLETRRVLVSGDTVKLTKSEFAILAVLMRKPGQIFTRNQLIASALGPNFNGYDRTVDTHVWSLRKKLKEPPGAPRYIHSEPGIGYRMEDRGAT